MENQQQQNPSATAGGCGCFLLIIAASVLYTSGYWSWIAACVLGTILILVAIFGGKAPEEKKHEEQKPEEQKPRVTVEVSTGETGPTFSIKGINLSGIDDSYLGDFIGSAVALISNRYDPYAIGVYRGRKRVGFLPKGNKELHAKIRELGGVTVSGYIAKATSEEDGHEFYYGKVTLIM